MRAVGSLRAECCRQVTNIDHTLCFQHLELDQLRTHASVKKSWFRVFSDVVLLTAELIYCHVGLLCEVEYAR